MRSSSISYLNLNFINWTNFIFSLIIGSVFLFLIVNGVPLLIDYLKDLCKVSVWKSEATEQVWTVNFASHEPCTCKTSGICFFVSMTTLTLWKMWVTNLCVILLTSNTLEPVNNLFTHNQVQPLNCNMEFMKSFFD